MNKNKIFIFIIIILLATIIFYYLYSPKEPKIPDQSNNDRSLIFFEEQLNKTLSNFDNQKIVHSYSSDIDKFNKKTVTSQIDTSDSLIKQEFYKNSNNQSRFTQINLPALFVDLYSKDPSANDYNVDFAFLDAETYICSKYNDNVVILSFSSTPVNIKNLLEQKITFENFYNNLDESAYAGCRDDKGVAVYEKLSDIPKWS